MSVALDAGYRAAERDRVLRRSRLAQALERAAQFLPTQGPIESFIHHNTLHAFEELQVDFHDALAAAGELYGARGYLHEHEYRDAYASGRITDRDLRAAIVRRQGPAEHGPDVGDVFRDRWLILRALLLHDCDPEHPAITRFRLAEGTALIEPGDVERWPAAFAALQGAGRRATAHAGTELRDRFGDRSHRDLVRALTGVDIYEQLDPWLIRLCASQLDEALAVEPRIDRQQGLYAAWRRWQRPGRGRLAELPRALVLPDDPIEASLLALDGLGVPDDRLDAYVRRVLLHLRGWAGMIRWRETHPDHRPELPPVVLADYLAVRLLAEWSALDGVCRRTWSCDVGQLLDHLAVHPDEVAVRLALFDGRLDDAHARAARRAVQLVGPARDRACAELSGALARDDVGPALAQAWQLLRVARALGLGGYELQSAPPAATRALLDAVDELGPAVRLPIWQEAFELHYRDEVLEAIHDLRGHREHREGRPPFQAIFCVDDREEGFRRHLEETAPDVLTYGAGGFFGIPISFRARGADGFTTLAPQGIAPAHRVLEVPLDAGSASPLGAWSAGFFAWLWRIAGRVLPRLRGPRVRALLPEHGTRLVTDEDRDDASHAIAGFSLREQVERINRTLHNIGLVNGFARVVIVLGHGSASVDNPHRSACDCGVCGGNHGAANARLFASMANSSRVRAGLRAIGVDIPDDTWFLGGEHDTGNEDITWSDQDAIPADHLDDFARVRAALDRARELSAHERCRRFEHAPPEASPADALRHVQERALDPSQARPELGNVTNAVAVFGRRELTRGAFFDRRMSLVSYDPSIDPHGRILERLLTKLAPIGAGVSLEYYFSRVDNAVYGAGTKLPHNVTGLVGVLDGGTSDLRTGLPKQLIEIHEPMRLLVVLESTPETVLAIAARQSIIHTLLVNRWITVATIDPHSGAMHVLDPPRGFVSWQSRGHALPTVACSTAWYRGKADCLPPVRIAPTRRLAGGV